MKCTITFYLLYPDSLLVLALWQKHAKTDVPSCACKKKKLLTVHAKLVEMVTFAAGAAAAADSIPAKLASWKEKEVRVAAVSSSMALISGAFQKSGLWNTEEL